MKEVVLDLIIKRFKSSNGSNGYYIVDLKNEINCELIELNLALKQLYKEKKIIIREGINGQLIMKRWEK